MDGGITGVGLGNSVQKYNWLPEAQSDFIFAIIGEELGLIGTLCVITAFLFLAWRGFRAALRGDREDPVNPCGRGDGDLRGVALW